MGYSSPSSSEDSSESEPPKISRSSGFCEIRGKLVQVFLIPKRRHTSDIVVVGQVD